MKLHLLIRRYPDQLACSVWLIQTDGTPPAPQTRQSRLHGSATLDGAKELAEALGLECVVEECQMEGMVVAGQQKELGL